MFFSTITFFIRLEFKKKLCLLKALTFALFLLERKEAPIKLNKYF